LIKIEKKKKLERNKYNEIILQASSSKCLIEHECVKNYISFKVGGKGTSIIQYDTENSQWHNILSKLILNLKGFERK
jgi:hypothetical protein